MNTSSSRDTFLQLLNQLSPYRPEASWILSLDRVAPLSDSQIQGFLAQIATIIGRIQDRTLQDHIHVQVSALKKRMQQDEQSSTQEADELLKGL